MTSCMCVLLNLLSEEKRNRIVEERTVVNAYDRICSKRLAEHLKELADLGSSVDISVADIKDETIF